jgi:hypothetical protein
MDLIFDQPASQIEENKDTGKNFQFTTSDNDKNEEIKYPIQIIFKRKSDPLAKEKLFEEIWSKKLI